jgi:hypothetical protein
MQANGPWAVAPGGRPRAGPGGGDEGCGVRGGAGGGLRRRRGRLQRWHQPAGPGQSGPADSISGRLRLLGEQRQQVAVGGGPDSGLASHPGAADSGQDRGDDMMAEGEQGADSAGGGWRDVVAAGPAGFVHELLAAELAQVISRLPDGIAVVAGDLPDPGCMLGDGEPARGWGQGERGGQGRPDPRLVQVDPGDPAGSAALWRCARWPRSAGRARPWYRPSAASARS